MKRKKYKVTVKLITKTTMIHEQKNMKNAQKDIERVINDYVKNGMDLKTIFNDKLEFIYKVEMYD